MTEQSIATIENNFNSEFMNILPNTGYRIQIHGDVNQEFEVFMFVELRAS